MSPSYNTERPPHTSRLVKGLLDMLDALQDCPEGVRRTALQALVNLNRAETTEALRDALRYSSEAGQDAAAWTLQQLDLQPD